MRPDEYLAVSGKAEALYGQPAPGPGEQPDEFRLPPASTAPDLGHYFPAGTRRAADHALPLRQRHHIPVTTFHRHKRSGIQDQHHLQKGTGTPHIGSLAAFTSRESCSTGAYEIVFWCRVSFAGGIRGSLKSVEEFLPECSRSGRSACVKQRICDIHPVTNLDCRVRQHPGQRLFVRSGCRTLLLHWVTRFGSGN